MTSLHATLTADPRCSLTLHAGAGTNIGGDTAWCRLARGHAGPCAFFAPEAIEALVAAWLGEDAQVETAAQALWNATPAYVVHGGKTWGELPTYKRQQMIEQARAALGALTHHEAST